jgi:hypothetical protein
LNRLIIVALPPMILQSDFFGLAVEISRPRFADPDDFQYHRAWWPRVNARPMATN